MRETLDCGVLMVPAHASWMQGWVQRHGAALSHIRLHAVQVEEGSGGAASGGDATAHAGAPVAAQFLARMAMSLRRFDACLLPVSAATLAWTRTALSCAGDGLHTPLVGVARGLKAAAVQDLLALGMRDFVRDPVCPEELRVRLDRVAGGKRVAGMGAPLAAPDKAGGRSAGLHGLLAEPHDAWPGPPTPAQSLCEPGWHYPATRPDRGECRPRLPQDAIDHALLSIQAAPRIHPDEPFRVAKSRVVDSFERDYLRTALSRHSGNVARAARASAKHRRAFWALMRKHDIDAAPYRPRRDAAEAGLRGDGSGANA